MLPTSFRLLRGVPAIHRGRVLYPTSHPRFPSEPRFHHSSQQLSTPDMSSNGNDQKQDLDPNQGGDSTKKTYHKQPTGEALKTADAHSAEHDLKLYGSCFCPFVHRVWISLEHKGLDYEYVEVDVYRKPKLLLDINPRGLVPALRHGAWGCYESTVLMEYLEDLNKGEPLLPKDPKLRAHSRLWSDHINRHIIPA